MPPESQVADLLVAALVGLAVGVEREWSGHATGPDARFAGLRTFTLLGAIGGFAGWFWQIDLQVLSACFVSGALLFVVAAYVAAMRRPGTSADGTTEVAAMLVVAMGTTAGLGSRSIASAAAAITVVLLAEKSRLQRALQRLDATELRATLQFAVMALVVLPMLPDRAMGPFNAFQPRELWTVVLVFSGLNFAGYIARRLVGETRGLGITGLLGGLISSTAVTFNFSRRSRVEPQFAAPLALGVVAACTVLTVRLLVIATMLQPALFAGLWPLLLPPCLTGIAVLVVALWREHATRPTPQRAEDATATATSSSTNGLPTNPLALATSLQMAVAFQVVLFLVAWAQERIGSTGVLVSAAILGLTDMDALTLSMTKLAADVSQLHVAAIAIGVGVIANTVLKLGVAVALGSSAFRVRTAVALLLLGASSTIALLLRW